MALQIFIHHGVILMVVALLVRFGGSKPLMAGSKYAGIRDMAAYNKWAGTRLLLLPVATLVIAWFSSGSIAARLFGFGLLWVVIIAVLVWISKGAKRF